MFKFVMTKNSNELFHRAILHNDIKRVRLILAEAMKDPRFNLDDINEEGLTALQFSCFAGNIEIVKILISYGANWKIRDRDGYTVLHAATMAGHNDVVSYLLRTGLRPTIRTDDGIMPIDVTEDVSLIVILLRSMLDQGFLQEMQEYMMDHPKLKRNIFEELKKVKCREKEKNEILRDLPYTSHTSPRKHGLSYTEKLKTNENNSLGRSRSTFSELSDSIQHLDMIARDYENNNDPYYPKEPIYEKVQERSSDESHGRRSQKLHRTSSSSSTSSHGSKTSRNSNSSGGILRHDNLEADVNHKNMQRYLENRYPVSSKTVTFNLRNDSRRSYSDGYASDNTISEDNYPHARKAYSDGYLSDNYDENFRIHQKVATVSRSSSVSSHSSNHSESCNSLEYQHSHEEPLYENTHPPKVKPNIPMPTIRENHYENLPHSVPPPIPPREPNYSPDQGVSIYGSVVLDRQLGSETDSGIDINETTGRVFALSLEDQRDMNETAYQSLKNIPSSAQSQSYSKPIGLFYSNQSQNLSAHQTGEDLIQPHGFFIRSNNKNSNDNSQLNSKYRSWNGRSLEQTQLAPYTSHRHRKSQDDSDIYNNVPVGQHPNDVQYQKNMTEDYKNYDAYQIDNNLRSYNFDHQPEIML